VTFAGADANAAKDLTEFDFEGLADAVDITRDFGNAPGLEVYPEEFAKRVRAGLRV